MYLTYFKSFLDLHEVGQELSEVSGERGFPGSSCHPPASGPKWQRIRGANSYWLPAAQGSVDISTCQAARGQRWWV